MSIGNRSALLAQAKREFRELVGERPAPSPGSFKPMRLNIDAFGRSWDAKRGAAVRLAAVLLKDDDQAMERRVCADDRTTTTYADATGWLEREAAYMRKTARLLDTAVSRLSVVLERCKSKSSVPEGA